jgi:hypothetical protein
MDQKGITWKAMAFGMEIRFADRDDGMLIESIMRCFGCENHSHSSTTLNWIQ